MSLPSLFDFQTEVLEKNGKCLSCGTPFMYGDIYWYEHEGGVAVKESPNKLWLYFECRKCDYQSALWKVEKQLGLDKEYVKEQLVGLLKEEPLGELTVEETLSPMKELWDNEEDEIWEKLKPEDSILGRSLPKEKEEELTPKEEFEKEFPNEEIDEKLFDLVGIVKLPEEEEDE